MSTEAPAEVQMSTSQALQSFPDCCLSISSRLVDAVVQSLHSCAELVLSIGCGSGRFESMLLDAGIYIVGIEVDSSLNKHLPKENFDVVADTRTLYTEAILATALLLVYPRPTSLVVQYLESLSKGALQKVIIITHRSDWDELLPRLQALAISTYEELPGTAAHEIAVVIQQG